VSRFARALPLALAFAVLPAATAAAAGAAEVVPGEVVVRFAPDTSSGMRAQALDAVDADGSQATPLPGTRLVTLADDADVRAAARTLERRSDVLWAEPNYVWHVDGLPNDPRFGELYGLRNTGQSVEQSDGTNHFLRPGTPGVDANVAPVWDVTTGSSSVRVGVADTGIAPHEDLNANLDVGASRDFVEDGGSGNPLADPDSHGTHVAGTIGAVGDNGIGVVGAMWHADLVSLRVLDSSGGSTLSIAAGFAYAGQAGIPIVNASLGGPGASRAMQDAIALASNTLFVVSAGNENTDLDASPSYPCSYPAANLICVASIDNDAARSWFSNYGLTSVDLGAPGNSILSTVPTYSAPTPISVNSSWTADPDWTFDSAFTFWNGDMPVGDPVEARLTPDTTLDLTDRKGCSIALNWGGQFGGKGGIVVERQVDGDWGRIGEISGDHDGPPADTRIGLRADGKSGVRVRFTLVAEPDSNPDGRSVQIYGLSYRCQVNGVSTDYETKSGTSMATPEVAGVAGLLKSAHPELTTAQLRTALLSTVVPTPSLAGKTVTGGRVDAAAALASITPAPPVPSGGGGGGGGTTTTTPAPVPTPTPDPLPVPGPTEPAAVPSAPASAAPAPRASLQAATGDLRSRGVLTVRAAVSSRATVKATATLVWRGGKLTLTAPARRDVRAGAIATLRLKATAKQRRALRHAGPIRARIVLTVTGADGRTRHVVRTVRLR
jgi:thermitase